MAGLFSSGRLDLHWGDVICLCLSPKRVCGLPRSFPSVVLGLWLGLALTGPVARADESVAVDVEHAQIARLAAKSLLLDATLAGERIIAVGERGHILLSDDNGSTWRQVRVPTRATLTAVYFPNESEGWAVGHDAVVLHSVDAGENWERQHYDPDLESLLDVWFADEKRGVAIGAYGLFMKTSDGGTSWQRGMISENDFHHNAIAESPDGRLYIAGEFGSIFRSSDAGRTWTEIDSPYEGSFFGILALPDRILVYGLRGRVYRSTDGGETWSGIETGTENSLMGGAVLADGGLVLAGLAGTVLLSSDKGASFERIERRDRNPVSAAVSLPDGRIAVFGAFGADVVEWPGSGDAVFGVGRKGS